MLDGMKLMPSLLLPGVHTQTSSGRAIFNPGR
jgi:hypothetical protein